MSARMVVDCALHLLGRLLDICPPFKSYQGWSRGENTQRGLKQLPRRYGVHEVFVILSPARPVI
jgi:hypothetical protein